jgi:hypothetical protein
VRQDRQGVEQSPEVPALPVDAARRHAAAAVRAGARRRGRHRLDIARLHRGPLPVGRGVRAAVHDAEPRRHEQGGVGLRGTVRSQRVQGRQAAGLPRARRRRVPHDEQADQDRRRPEGPEAARADAPDQQVPGRARRHAGEHAGAPGGRRPVQGCRR